MEKQTSGYNLFNTTALPTELSMLFPCFPGGDEEEDFPELQTARDWSEDEEDEEEGGGGGSSLVWGTPHQNSSELTFSYITFSEPEAGQSRLDSVGARRRRSRPVGLSRTDTAETLLPDTTRSSPLGEDSFAQWDPAFSLAEDSKTWEQGLSEDLQGAPERSLQYRLQLGVSEPLGGLMDRIPDGQISETEDVPPGSSIIPELLQSSADPCVTSDTTTLPGTGHQDITSHHIGLDTQEEQISEQWYTALTQSESPEGGMLLSVVSELIYWKDSKQTGAVFTGLVVALISLSQLSIISVISNLAFLLMCVTLGMRLYTKILQVLNKSDGASPFHLSQEQTQCYVDRVILMGTAAAVELRRLALVEDFIDSLKAQIDQYVELVRAHISDIRAKIQAKIPSAKPKEE
ncbi:UNVERIFIED_CONTAM: hypothetical protein FKN15_065831 [Acipenser sinensis]